MQTKLWVKSLFYRNLEEGVKKIIWAFQFVKQRFYGREEIFSPRANFELEAECIGVTMPLVGLCQKIVK